jgi:hypothetical protein
MHQSRISHRDHRVHRDSNNGDIHGLPMNVPIHTRSSGQNKQKHVLPLSLLSLSCRKAHLMLSILPDDSPS